MKNNGQFYSTFKCKICYYFQNNLIFKVIKYIIVDQNINNFNNLFMDFTCIRPRVSNLWSSKPIYADLHQTLKIFCSLFDID